MYELGKKIASALNKSAIIYFKGELGAGKTTLIRGILQGLGISEHIKSPTYSLVETYQINHQQIFHFDFYRVQDKNELEHIGLREYFSQPAIVLIEWPEIAQDFIDQPDIECAINIKNEGRELNFVAKTESGKQILNRTIR